MRSDVWWQLLALSLGGCHAEVQMERKKFTVPELTEEDSVAGTERWLGLDDDARPQAIRLHKRYALMGTPKLCMPHAGF